MKTHALRRAIKTSLYVLSLCVLFCAPLITQANNVEDVGGNEGAAPPPESRIRATQQEAITAAADRLRAAPTSTPEQTTDSGVHFTPVTPELSVPIPGLTFTTAYAEGDQLVVPYLAQYISAVYRYLLGISTLVAIIVVIYGGFLYLIGQTTGSTKQGLALIKDAVAGLIVLYSSYLILWTVNPNLVNLQPIRLDLIHSVAIGEGSGAFGDSYEDTSGSNQCRMQYNQGNGDWARVPYGESSALISNGTDARATCATAAESNTTRCIGNFQQSGCGPTAVASVLRFYGLQVAVPNRVPAPGNAMHPIDPIDTGILAVLKGYRIIARGTTGEIARHVNQNFPQFTSRTIETSDTAAIINALNTGHPLVFSAKQQGVHLFSDEQATQPMNGGAPMYTGGHYMVLSGVVSNDILRVHDVGNGRTKTIRMAELQANAGGIVEIKPKTSYQETMTATWGTVQVQMNLPSSAASGGQCRAGPSHSNSSNAVADTAAVAGETLRLPFTYPATRTAAQTVAAWPNNAAHILYPARLRRVEGASIHVYIYLHGDNSGDQTAEQRYLPLLDSALRQVAGSKNVVILAPHHNHAGDAYPGFSLSQFYTDAMAALQTVMPNAIVLDTVVGGHSGATCQGGPVITQAISSSLPHPRGVIAYDGCAAGAYTAGGQGLTPENFTPAAGVAEYINADLSGMGNNNVTTPTNGTLRRNLAIRSLWGLSQQTCPVCAQNAGVSACYGPNATFQRTGNSGELILLETAAGHKESVELMTKVALCAFYRNSSTAAR